LDGFVGITVNQRQKYYNFPNYNDFCDPIKTDILTKFGTNIISPGGQIIYSNAWVCTNDISVTVTETYWGTDDNGNAVQDSYSFTVS